MNFRRCGRRPGTCRRARAAVLPPAHDPGRRAGGRARGCGRDPDLRARWRADARRSRRRDDNAIGSIDAENARGRWWPLPAATDRGRSQVRLGVGGEHRCQRGLRDRSATNAVYDKIKVGSAPAGIAVGGGFVWVTNSLDSTVSRINTQDGATEEIPVGNGPTGIAFDERGGHVWVVNTHDQTISRIGARDGKVKTFSHAEVPPDPGAVAVGAGALWVASKSDNTVVKLDPRSGRQLLEPIHVGQVPAAILVGLDSVWVANSVDGTVSQIDPADGRIAAVIPVDAGPSGLALAGDEVWTANELAGTLSRIDPRAGTASRGFPWEAKAGRRRSQVEARPSTSRYEREERLTAGDVGVAVDGSSPLKGVDPALGTFSELRRFISLTNDGLVTYRHVGGQAGYQLVPDLADSPPQISPDRKTYRFTLRPNVRYSDGRPVKASDFRHSIERGYMLLARADPTATFSGILGAERCGPRRCNLAAGIETDDAARTVTFHLSEANPYFLYDLASGFLVPGYVVPGDTPVQEAKRRPLPATGPYRIEGFTRRSVRLVRNPYFHQWSKDAQPAGSPDEIVLTATGAPLTGDVADADRLQKGLEDRVALVQQQKADLTSLSRDFPVDVRFRHLFKPHPDPALIYLALDTDRPPFDDRRARQAVSYALDRNRVVQIFGSEDATKPACQVLPPHFPAYRPYCPYTLDPSAKGELGQARPGQGEATRRGVGNGRDAREAVGSQRAPRPWPLPEGAP